MRNEHSKNRINFLASGTVFTAFLLLLCLILTGCDFSGDFTGKKEKKEPKRQYSVVVQDSVLFVPTVSTATVSEGGTFTTELVYYRGFSFDSCNYENAVIEKTVKGVKITLEDIDSDKRLIIKSKSVGNSYEFPEKTGTITYYANGGKFGGGSDTLIQNYTISYHLKPNTDIGEKLTRQGYVLTGWNTKADGTGVHVGLGSRTDYYELYAEWAAYTNPALFTYRRTGDGIALTGYKGATDVDPLVIPEYIDGMEVVEIDTSFTTNIPCGTIKSSTLILPKSIVTIKSGAFKNAEFTTLYFYDSLETVDEGAFGQRISYYHINAATAPHHQNGNDNARFADKVDYLSMQEGKRLVVFGGCSASYGIDSQLLGEDFSEYSVCNMGVIGGVNAIFQMQIIGHFLHEGDIFIHAPEEMSQHQLMRTLSVDYRVFILVEGNYDLLSYADFSYTDVFWEGYNNYIANHKDTPEGSYSDYTDSYNIYGDIIIDRPFIEENAWEEDVTRSENSYYLDLDILTDSGIERLCGFYSEFKEKGVKVFITYGPISEEGLQNGVTVEEFETKFLELLARFGYAPMGSLSDHVFKGRYFYDSDYHLNYGGVLLQTKQIIEELKKAIK